MYTQLSSLVLRKFFSYITFSLACFLPESSLDGMLHKAQRRALCSEPQSGIHRRHCRHPIRESGMRAPTSHTPTTGLSSSSYSCSANNRWCLHFLLIKESEEIVSKNNQQLGKVSLMRITMQVFYIAAFIPLSSYFHFKMYLKDIQVYNINSQEKYIKKKHITVVVSNGY